ncbi:unnamed protein product, partial [Mesorhabditis belari]|uniref:Hexosyltransferase n=1 Tax=Mesorhabditis belari TaxID=2138241 RepID=A0AAF3FGI9_9BILA
MLTAYVFLSETHSIENIARKAVETTSLSLISTTKNGANKPMFKDKLLRPFGFVIKPERKVCTDTTRVFIAIHSAASNFGRRQVIRETYAQRKLQERYEFSFLFTLGLQESDLFQKWIVAEAKEFDDILQGNFQEHYHNMTIKKLIWMRYAMGNCQKTKWIVHLDDDALLDIHSLIDFFENKKVFDSNTLYCMAISYNQTLVVRNPYSKWFVSEDAYPLDFYPKYCAGAAYILPQKALYLMDEAIKGMEYITVDDAFITGIVREAVGIDIRQLLPNGIVRHELDPLIHKFQTGRAVMAECPNEHCMRHLWEIINSLHKLTQKPNVNISITTIPDYHPMEVEILVRYGETIHFDGGIDVQSLYELNSTREITLPQYVRYPRKLIFISLTLPISLMILLFLCKICVFLANFFEEYYKKRVFTE